MKKTILWTVVMTAGLALGISGCGGKDDGSGSGDSGASDDDDDDDDDDTDPGGSETGTPGTGGGDSSGGQMTFGFIENPDGGGVSFECDIFAQDCPPGEKCMPWANDGGTSWNATRCSPVMENPGQPGDECTVEGGGTSGVDSCDIGSMCWDVDGETNVGTCTAMCTGAEDAPICEDPDTNCSIANDGAIVLCLPACDPLLQDCDEGQACYPITGTFVCAPDASGEMGIPGDPCEFINVCDTGLFCAAAAAVPGCTMSSGCCSEFCDLSDPTGAAQCSLGGGQDCVPAFEEGMTPPGYEDVGLCAIPA